MDCRIRLLKKGVHLSCDSNSTNYILDFSRSQDCICHPPPKNFHSRKYATVTFFIRKCSQFSSFFGGCCWLIFTVLPPLLPPPLLYKQPPRFSVPFPHRSMNLIGGGRGRGAYPGGRGAYPEGGGYGARLWPRNTIVR